MKRIEWDRGFGESRAARLFAYTFVAAPAGMLLLFAGALGIGLFALGGSILANPELLALVVLFALVGGPLSLLYLWPLLTDPEQRRGIVTESWLAKFPKMGLLLAVVAGLVVHIGAFLAFQQSPYILAAVGVVVGGIGIELLLTAGDIDPEARTLTVKPGYDAPRSWERTVDLDAWTDLATYRLGPVALLRPSYASGTSGSRPRLLTIPAWVADEAEPVFAAGIDTPVPEVERDPDPLVAVTLVLFGLGFAAVAGAIWLLEVGPAEFRLWFVAVFGVFGALFLAIAFQER